jgi:hypothetical protein
MWKKLVNKILHKFGYHLVRNPRPYQRKKESFKKEEEKELFETIHAQILKAIEDLGSFEKGYEKQLANAER